MKKTEKQFRILDLFCGAGGLSYGMHKNPHFITEVALDFNAKAADTFRRNMPDTEVVVGDITDEAVRNKIISLSRKRGVNMVMGGPPCQGFSLKGKKLGLKDPRNYLFVQYLEIVKELQPEVFLIENVKALLSTSAGWFKDQIVKYQKLMRAGSTRLYNHQASNHKQVAIDKLAMIPPEKGKECLPEELLGKQQFSSTWGRLVWDEVSPTIDTRFDAASNGKNNHPYLNRAITPREAARIQSFDDRFIFYGSKYYIRQQIGNAVPTLLAKAIADQIYSVLG